MNNDRSIVWLKFHHKIGILSLFPFEISIASFNFNADIYLSIFFFRLSSTDSFDEFNCCMVIVSDQNISLLNKTPN
ncbi:unnamed protein product [Schistosoma mattheei]|uniref:Uncharacterized protein n=1 Tax=Schistosoma mattheei TaxID=31246 RepID=A0A3P8ECC6_9TREM|nr:unnamed protein product [Schistosoma mattheei]